MNKLDISSNSSANLSLEITLPGELGEKERDEVSLRDGVEGWPGWDLLSGSWCGLGDGLRVGDSDLGLVDGWVVVLRSAGDHLRDWEDGCRDLVGGGDGVWLVRGAEKGLGELRGARKQVG